MEILSFFKEIISFKHLNILFLLGLSLFGGTVGGRLFRKIKIPQVVGYIIIGIILGHSGFNIVNDSIVNLLRPLNYFALGLIGFMIGGELKFSTLKRFGRQFIYILFYEAFGAFIAVSIFTFICAYFFMPLSSAIAFSLVIGAISAATAAAGTTDVLWEYKAKGPLTTTLLGIIALDDILALFLFVIMSSVAGSLLGDFHSESNLMEFIKPLYEIFGALLIGVGGGLLISFILKKRSDIEKTLDFSIGLILLILGFCRAINIGMLLTATLMGTIFTNRAPRRSEEVFSLLDKIAAPIYVMFFVLVGAKLNVENITMQLFIFLIAYLLGRSLGKMTGAYIGGRISGAPAAVSKYLPLCLFSQSGAAIGMSILASQKFHGMVGDYILTIITTSTFVVQIIGPIFLKIGIVKAKEVNLNITESDILLKYNVSDVIGKDDVFIRPGMLLPAMLEVFTEHNNLYYPVVDDNKKMLGVIGFDDIKDTFLLSGLNNVVVASDIMKNIDIYISDTTPLVEAEEKMKKDNLDFIPVIDSENNIVGILEERRLKKFIAEKMYELHRKIKSLAK